MVFHLLFYGILLFVAVYDFKNKRIPDWFVVALFLLGLVSMFFLKQPSIEARVTGIIMTPLIPVICNFVKKGAFGGGDLKFLSACGFYLGWKLAFVGLVASIICCGIYCLAGMLVFKLNRKTILAFGPFISVGMFLASQYGDYLIRWYFT